MGVLANIKRWFMMVFSNKAKEVFDIKNVTSNKMEAYVAKCGNIYKGKPSWLDEDDGIKTINFAKFLCTETAKLTTMGMSVVIDGESERIKTIQKQIDDAKSNVRQWVEYAGAYGTVILKPNGNSIDVVLPGKYMVTDQSNGKITGCVFVNQEISDDGKKFYTRLEYHRFIKDIYVITNKCYVGETENDLSQPIVIEDTPWGYMQDELAIDKVDSMLFGVLKMPNANSIDEDSPLAMPLFADALEELKDLDIAYSRNVEEIMQSSRIVLLDSDRMTMAGTKVAQGISGLEYMRDKMKLPKYVRNVMGDGSTSFYQEINPTLQTAVRLEGINSLLSQIGFKCGFSNGYFVFNQQNGFATATQVTADQSRTIQLIEDIRKMLDVCFIDLIKAINVFEDIYGTTGHVDINDSASTSELDRMIHLHFEPIYTNKEEDRARAYQLTQTGYYPKWYYLHMYEGLDEETAKALTQEATADSMIPGLFDE